MGGGQGANGKGDGLSRAMLKCGRGRALLINRSHQKGRKKVLFWSLLLFQLKLNVVD